MRGETLHHRVPATSTLNVSPGQSVANWSDRVVGFYNNSGNIHLTADLAGAFAGADPTPCTSDCVYALGQQRWPGHDTDPDACLET